MTKYHPLYAYAIVSVVLILGIQMMLTDGTSGITGLAVGDQQGGTPQGGDQQDSSQQSGSQGSQQGFFQKVGGFFGLGDNKDVAGQAGAAGQGNKGKGTAGQTSGTGGTTGGTAGQTGSSGQQPLVDDGTDTDGDGITDAVEKSLGLNYENTDTDGDGLTDKEELEKTLTDPKNTDTDGDGIGDRDDTDNSSAASGSSSGSGGTSGTTRSSTSGTGTNTQNQGQPCQQISDESKSCVDAINEKMAEDTKSCTRDAVQKGLDEAASADDVMAAIEDCFKKYDDEYKDDRDACFKEASE